jgi:voltage-gated potassium channel
MDPVYHLAFSLLILIVFGIGIIIAYAVGNLIQFMAEGQIRQLLGNKVEKQISKVQGHYIIYGYGRIGTLICEEF